MSCLTYALYKVTQSSLFWSTKKLLLKPFTEAFTDTLLPQTNISVVKVVLSSPGLSEQSYQTSVTVVYYMVIFVILGSTWQVLDMSCKC